MFQLSIFLKTLKITESDKMPKVKKVDMTVEDLRLIKREKIILVWMLAFMAFVVVGGVVSTYIWDNVDPAEKVLVEKDVVVSTESKNPDVESNQETESSEPVTASKIADDEPSYMEINCVNMVLKVSEEPDAIVSDVTYRGFPWIDGDDPGSDYFVGGFSDTEIDVVIYADLEIETEPMSFTCTSMDAIGDEIEVFENE